ncbi:hypothetical protein ACKXF7_11045 [Faecalibacterium sp. 7]|uniref:hypothetical protein n=1 Tax=Faecalibacterium sp. 7 TaxID=3402017 RepID=UPI003C2C93A6
MRLRKNMKRTAAAALALSMAVSTAAVPASAGYNIDMSDATKITGDVEIKQEADGSGTKITISVDGKDKTTDFSDGKEDDKITITGDNTKSAATTTAAADAAKDDTKAPETTVTENKDGTVISYTGELDAQPDQEVSRPDSQNDQNDPEADQKNQGDQADQNDPEADQKNQGDQGDQGDPEADQNDQKNQSDPEADQSGQKNQNKDSEDADAGIMTYEAPAPTTLTSAVAAAFRNVIKIINNVAGAENALNITLDNATIKSDSKAAMKISGEGDVNIELNHSNVLTSGEAHAGLEKNDKDSKGRLTIRDDLKNDGTAKTGEEKKAEEDAVAAGETGDAVKDVGSLTATGGYSVSGYGGAGIGGGCEDCYSGGSTSTSSIVINGGKITATGGEKAAGIGGSAGGYGGRVNRKDPDDRSQTITINGGNIEAAGIGGASMYNNGGNGSVTITGGHIKSEGKYGAGIGGGWGGYIGGDGDVLITGGVIEAEGLRGAGIGGGGSDYDRNNDPNRGSLGGDAKVKIRGKNTIIKAEGHLGAGIGGGSVYNPSISGLHNGGSAEIEITDGATVKEAVGGTGGAGIGSGAGDGFDHLYVYKTNAHVTIKNATVEVAKSDSPSKSNTYGAGIGGGGTRGHYWFGENVITIINSVIGRIKLDQNGNREKDANGNYLLDSGTGALGTHGSEGIGRGANELGEMSEILDGKNDVIIDNSWVPDGDKMKQEFNHIWHDTETLPTCTEDGEKGKVCSRCGMKETEKIPALGHAWGAWTVTTPATCTNEGVETRICNRDPSHVETRTIPATGHNWVDNGNGTHTCTNCGATEAFGALELRVVDAEGMNKSFTVSQNGTLRTYTGAYDTATLTGDLNTLRYLQDHGAQTIQFVTNGQTSSFDINDLLAQGSGSEVFYLTHRGTEEPTLLLVEADHSELVKD